MTIRIGWLSDDSLITLRTALNITSGWGPGFNPSESVQGYTHPLWFMLWTFSGSLSGQWIVSVLVLSVTFTTFSLVAVMSAPGPRAALPFVFLLLALSNSFMEYSTSGLENPLSHCLVGVLVLLLSRQTERGINIGYAVCVGVASALLFLNRFDLVLLVGPGLSLWIVRASRRVRCVSAVSFLLPVAVWMSWSYATYRTVLPNTFLAKRNLDIDQLELLGQGLFYLRVSLTHDLAGAALLVTALILGFVSTQRLVAVQVLGIPIYLAYVVSNGGDFMVGRFLSTPIYLAAVSIPILLKSRRYFPFPAWKLSRVKTRIPANYVVGSLAGVLLLGTFGPSAVSLSRQPYERFDWQHPNSRGIADERGFYASRGRGVDFLVREYSLAISGTQCSTGNTTRGCDLLSPFSIVDISRQANGWPEKTEKSPLLPRYVEVTCGLLGGKAILSGPQTHWVDTCGLTDRVMAGITFRPSEKGWRIGHFEREIPPGYLEAVANNDVSFIVDPSTRRQVEAVWGSIRRN